MATRNQQQQQQQRVKLQKAAAGGRSRRVLGDIGNLVKVPVVEGKPQLQINRPFTRSFGAQLIANAQRDAAANKKKPVEQQDIVADVALEKAGARAVKQKAVASKPKPETVIEINPDTDEKEKLKSSRKSNVDTLTTVLTARSKAACGITDKPKELAEGIDAADAGDEFCVVDYVEDLYTFYKLSENANKPHDYIGSQVEINSRMRAILTDWLIEVHHKFKLRPETLYLTICIIDRYLSMEIVARRELQLVGVSAMLIACKYEEIWAPEVHDFICISDRVYTREQILRMEKCILNHLEWYLTFPTPYVFLVRFLKAAFCDQEMENMVFFLAELGLMQYNVMITYCPSMIAASAVYAARCTLNKIPFWTQTLRHYSGYSEQQLLDCAHVLASSHSVAPESKLQTLYKKYSSIQLGAVALHRPAIKLLDELKASTITTTRT